MIFISCSRMHHQQIGSPQGSFLLLRAFFVPLPLLPPWPVRREDLSLILMPFRVRFVAVLFPLFFPLALLDSIILLFSVLDFTFLGLMLLDWYLLNLLWNFLIANVTNVEFVQTELNANGSSDFLFVAFLAVNQHVNCRWDVDLLQLWKLSAHQTCHQESFADICSKTLDDDKVILLDEFSCFFEVDAYISLSHIDLIFVLVIIC